MASALALAILAPVTVAQEPAFSATVSDPPPTAPDAWGPPSTFRTADGWYAAPIHASLMPDGRVHFIGIERRTATARQDDPFRRSAFVVRPTPLGAHPPAELTISKLTQPVAADGLTASSSTAEDPAHAHPTAEAAFSNKRVSARGLTSSASAVEEDLVCSGHTLTADGKLFTAGGTRELVNTDTGERSTLGLPYATLFDGTAWHRLPQEMRAAGLTGQPLRWYPTVTRLPNARLLVTSGFDSVDPTPLPNLSAETYDPAAGSWTVNSPFGRTPFEILNSDYTHAFVLPDPEGANDRLMLGEPGVPVLMSNRETAAWSIQNDAPRPESEAFQAARIANGGRWQSVEAPGNGASSALLPIRVRNGEWGYRNGSVLVAGGPTATSFARNVDAYDPVAKRWFAHTWTPDPRKWPMAVSLPDSRILLLGGADEDPDVRRGAYVDPQADFRFTRGSSEAGEVRGYHAVSLLLPDGRVLVGGGRDVDKTNSTEKPTFRYYHPHYLFLSRPQIVSSPSSLRFGNRFTLTSRGTKPPAEAVLVSLGSMTHSIDMNQRVVQLEMTDVVNRDGGRFDSTLTAPPNPHTAPPGHYMLFVLDSQRVPSVARIVHLR